MEFFKGLSNATPLLTTIYFLDEEIGILPKVQPLIASSFSCAISPSIRHHRRYRCLLEQYYWSRHTVLLATLA